MNERAENMLATCLGPISRACIKIHSVILSFCHSVILSFCHSRCNSWKKRGLAIIPNKYCLAFGIDYWNQGGALLHVYTDGSILLTHGGIEMGQGLHTKMIQVSLILRWLLFSSL